MSSYFSFSTSTNDASNPPVTPIRSTLPLCILPENACPKRTSRKRAPPSPLDATFASQRREYLFTLSTASNRGLLSPSTPTAPLLPPAPIFMPLPETPKTATAATHNLSSSPMKRSPAMRNFCRFTEEAFREEREGVSSSDEEDSYMPFSKTNSLGLFGVYRERSSTSDSMVSSAELPSSPSTSDDGRWSDAYESETDDSSIGFARRISLDVATPYASPSLYRTIPLPSLDEVPATSHPHVYESDGLPSSPVPSLSFSDDNSPHSSPASSLASISNSPPSSPSPSPVTACISSFETTSFFSSPLSSGSSLARRRLDTLAARRASKGKLTTLKPAVVVVGEDREVFGLGLMA
ncbi:hypothetical protein JCM11641_006169 [Rhodosporidiobolus odoratus]